MTPANVTDDGTTVTIAVDTADFAATILETEAAQRHGRVVVWTLKGEAKHRFEPETAESEGV